MGFSSSNIPVRDASRSRAFLPVLLVAPFMAQADATIANVATPSIHADLGATGASLELVIGGYLIAFAALLITGARLGQTHGYRRLFLVGIAGFGLSSLACGLAPDPTVLITARVLQGASAALMFPQALTGIQTTFNGTERVRAIGLYAIALSVGAVAGQILGGVLISANVGGSEWRGIFLPNVPIAALTVAAALRYLPFDVPRAQRRVDLPGVVALAAAVLLVVLPLVLGRVEGWPLWAWICLAASAPVFALFVLLERRRTTRGGAALINLPVLARPSVAWALMALLVATGTYYALLFTLAQFLQRGLGDSALVSGLTLVPWVAAFGAAGQIVRRLPSRLAAYAPASGCLLLAVAYAAIAAALFSGHRSEPLLLILLAFGGLGLGINFSAIIAHLTNVVPPGYAADISGVSSTTAAIGGAFGVAGFGTLYLALAQAGDAANAFAILSAAFAAAAIVAAFGAERGTRGHQRILRQGCP
jgi:MFS family permease